MENQNTFSVEIGDRKFYKFFGEKNSKQSAKREKEMREEGSGRAWVRIGVGERRSCRGVVHVEHCPDKDQSEMGLPPRMCGLTPYKSQPNSEAPVGRNHLNKNICK